MKKYEVKRLSSNVHTQNKTYKCSVEIGGSLVPFIVCFRFLFKVYSSSVVLQNKYLAILVSQFGSF